MTRSTLKRRVWHLVEAGRGAGDRSDRFDWFDWLIAGLIVLNVVALVLETERELHTRYASVFHAFEVTSLCLFAAEYLLRIWSCNVAGRYAHPVWGRLRYAVRPLQLIDLLALVPAVLLFLPDLRAVRLFRLLRILRVLKIGRYSDAVGLLGRVLRSRRAELAVMCLVLCVLLVLSATAMHYAEQDAQPDKFGSIPDAMWWAVITLTTIGYGDVFPVTPVGKALGGLIAVSGIGIVALPTAIIASAFSEELRRTHEAKQQAREVANAESSAATSAHEASQATGQLACPHCGKPIALHAAAGQI